MTLPQENPFGVSKALSFGRFSTEVLNRDDFVAWLLQTGEADTLSRANQIYTQAREHYWGDTGTVTSRPHINRVNRYAAYRMESDYLVTNLFTSVSDVSIYNAANPQNPLSRRQGSGSADLNFPALYIQDAALFGIGVIVSEGIYSFVWATPNS